MLRFVCPLLGSSWTIPVGMNNPIIPSSGIYLHHSGYKDLTQSLRDLNGEKGISIKKRVGYYKISLLQSFMIRPVLSRSLIG